VDGRNYFARVTDEALRAPRPACILDAGNIRRQNMNIPGPTEVHIRAMAAILAQPRVWHMTIDELQEVAAAATNGMARPWRVKCTIKIMRRGRGLGNIVKGDTT
jgi:hypothetical protein